MWNPKGTKLLDDINQSYTNIIDCCEIVDRLIDKGDYSNAKHTQNITRSIINNLRGYWSQIRGDTVTFFGTNTTTSSGGIDQETAQSNVRLIEQLTAEVASLRQQGTNYVTLNNQVTSLQAEINNLRNENNNLRNLQSENNSLRAEISALRNLKYENDNLNIQIRNLNETNARLQRETEIRIQQIDNTRNAEFDERLRRIEQGFQSRLYVPTITKK